MIAINYFLFICLFISSFVMLASSTKNNEIKSKKDFIILVINAVINIFSLYYITYICRHMGYKSQNNILELMSLVTILVVASNVILRKHKCMILSEKCYIVYNLLIITISSIASLWTLVIYNDSIIPALINNGNQKYILLITALIYTMICALFSPLFAKLSYVSTKVIISKTKEAISAIVDKKEI